MKPDKIVKMYSEDRDCGANSALPEFNALKLKTVNNGIGSYVVIETARWAVDEDSLEQLFLEIKNMLKEAN